MAARQIAFASARYVDSEGQARVGHRGDICEIPVDEIKRLDKLGALVPQGGELHRPGVLLPLVESADDEKIANYLLSGNSLEILTQASSYPTTLVEKLVIAEEQGLNRQPLLAGLRQRVGVLTVSGPSVAQLEASVAIPSPLATVTPDVAPLAPTNVTDDLDDYAKTSTVEDIVERAGDDKELAQRLLDAEVAGKNRKTAVDQLTAIIEA